MYHQAPHLPRRRRSSVLPFLILIILGLTGILVFQIFSHFQEQNKKITENKAALTVAEGRAEMLVWGEKNWVASKTGSILREGDRLHLFAGSRATLALLNGSFVRVNGDALFSIGTLRTRDNDDEVQLTLEYGELWLRKTKKENVLTSFVVETQDFAVRSASTIFAVFHKPYDQNLDFRARVMEGKVDVDIKEQAEDGTSHVIETIPVGVGQEIFIDTERLKKFRARKSPDILVALSDQFKASDWYRWNASQDAVKSSVLTVEEAVIAQKEAETQEKKVLLPTLPTVAQESPSKIATIFPAPEIIEPNTASRRTSASKVLVRGTTSAQTQKIIAKSFVGGKEDAYALQKYKPGSTDWNYIVDAAFGNWIPGRNRFEIIAVDFQGRVSEPASLELFYDKDQPKADLAIPKITGFNGRASSEIVDDVVKVEGTIGNGIVKMFVNDFALTRYVPNSGAWVYYAKIEYKNLKVGVNLYEAYGLDAQGRKTPTLKFTITKLLKPGPEPTSENSPLE